VGLERGPLRLVSTIENLLERKISGSGLESREYGRRHPSGWRRDTFYPQKLALTSPTSGCRSVGIVLSRTKATEFVCFWLLRGSALWNIASCNPSNTNLLFGKHGAFIFSIKEQTEQGSNENEVENSVTVHATHLVHLTLLYRKIAGRAVQVMGLQTNRSYLARKPESCVCSDTCAVRVAWIFSALPTYWQAERASRRSFNMKIAYIVLKGFCAVGTNYPSQREQFLCSTWRISIVTEGKCWPAS
jgi:hypothetical protein